MKIALITGGSRGIGKSAALRVAASGVAVVLTYNSQQHEAENVVNMIEAAGGHAIAMKLNTADVSSFKDFSNLLSATLLKKFGTSKFDYLLNNAGTGASAKFAETSEEQFDDLMKIHVRGPFFLTQILLPMMNDGGGILNVSSVLTRFSIPGSAPYAMAKGAVEVMTRYLSQELGPRGINVNTLAPGAIATDFNGGRMRDSEEINSFVSATTNFARIGLPDDVGKIVAFLFSQDSHWINAQRIEVSGGMFS